MKPCFICHEPKTYHDWYFIHGAGGVKGHEFQPDNLAYLERQLKLKEAAEKRHKLNFCQICKLERKSPFGICKECSEKIIVGKGLQEIK